MKKRLQKLGPSVGGFALLAALTSMNVACAPTADSLGKTLAFASFEFNDGIRWRKYQQASKRLSPVIRDAYLDHAERTDEKINVSEINLLRTKIDIKLKTAVLRFRYIWHRTDRGLVRKTVVMEHWKQIKDVWFVMKILRASGKEFPLFVGLTPEAQKRKKARPQPPRKVRRATSLRRPQPGGPARR
jgi:hypothetical protein